MSESSAEEELAAIRAFLDDEVAHDGAEDLSVLERVRDVVNAVESWSKLAVRRLHEIHRLTGAECEHCAKYLGPVT